MGYQFTITNLTALEIATHGEAAIYEATRRSLGRRVHGQKIELTAYAWNDFVGPELIEMRNETEMARIRVKAQKAEAERAEADYKIRKAAVKKTKMVEVKAPVSKPTRETLQLPSGELKKEFKSLPRERRDAITKLCRMNKFPNRNPGFMVHYQVDERIYRLLLGATKPGTSTMDFQVRRTAETELKRLSQTTASVAA